MADKIYVLVKNFRGVNDDVEVLETEKEAEEEFRKYTGFDFIRDYTDLSHSRFSEEYSETRIFEIDLPDFLILRRRSHA